MHSKEKIFYSVPRSPNVAVADHNPFSSLKHVTNVQIFVIIVFLIVLTHYCRWPSLLASYHGYDKLPQTQWLKVTQTSYFTILNIRHWKWAPQVKTKVSAMLSSFWSLQNQIHFLPFPASRDCPHSRLTAPSLRLYCSIVQPNPSPAVISLAIPFLLPPTLKDPCDTVCLPQVLLPPMIRIIFLF